MQDLYLVSLRDSYYQLVPGDDGNVLLQNVSLEYLRGVLDKFSRVLVASVSDEINSELEDFLGGFPWMVVSLSQVALAGVVLNDYGMVKDFGLLADRCGAVVQVGDYGFFSIAEGGLFQLPKFFEVRGWTVEKLHRLPAVLADKNGFSEGRLVVCGFGDLGDYTVLLRGLRALAERYGLRGSESLVGPSAVVSEVGSSVVEAESSFDGGDGYGA